MNNLNFEKDNESAAYRVFETLKLLMQKPASTCEIIQYLESINPDNKRFSNVAIHKYLNTLKFSGIDIIKVANRYQVKKLPFILDLTEENLYAIALMQKCSRSMHEEALAEALNELLYQVKIRMKKETINKYNEIETSIEMKCKDLSEELIRKIKECEKLCKDSLKLKITYKKDSKEYTINCVPIELKHQEDKIYFSVFNLASYNMIDIRCEDLIKIEQFPTKVNSEKIVPTTTMFKLFGKLAQRYELRNGEISQGYDEKGALVVISRQEDKDILLKRLMHYGGLCEVISPAMHRLQIQTLIDETLANYK